MAGRVLNVLLISVLLLSPSFGVRLPSFLGSSKLGVLVEKDVKKAFEKIEESPMLKKMMALVSLHATSGEPLDDVLSLLQGIMNDLRMQQKEANSAWALLQSELTDSMKTFKTSFTTAQALRDQAQTSLNEVNSKITTTSG